MPRDAVVRDRTTWLMRAKALLMAAGSAAKPTPGGHRWLELAASRDGVVINARATVEADHVVLQNLTFDLTGYVLSQASSYRRARRLAGAGSSVRGL